MSEIVALNLRDGSQYTRILAIFLILGAILALMLYRAAYSTDIARIGGISELPGAKPFIGHLHLHAGASGVNDAQLWSRWGYKLKDDFLQVKFGNRRVVIANTYYAVKELFVKNASLTSGRPKQYVFESYIGYDLGTHSLDPVYKRQRNAAIKAAQPRQWPSYYPFMEREGFEIVQNIAAEGNMGSKPIEVLEMFRKVSMNLSFKITFGKRFSSPNDPWLRRYISHASAITSVRGASNTWVDFVPFLRLLPSHRAVLQKAKIASETRDEMISEIMVELQNKISRGEEVNCIAGSVLQDKDTSLTLQEAVKCSMSMLQGGVETVPSTLFAGLGSLLSEAGLDMQDRAYEAIREVYSSDEEAVEKCFREEKVPYIVALYKEMLRYYTITPFSLPRATVSDVKLKKQDGKEIIIPAGTHLYMNAEGSAHDKAHYGPDADTFRPDRWLKDFNINGPGMPHVAYGIGSRLCPAWQISNRIMYGILVRIIVAYKMLPDRETPPPKDYFTFGATPSGVVNIPKLFKINFIPRNQEELIRQLEEPLPTAD